MKRKLKQRLNESTLYWRDERPLTTQHYLIVVLFVLTLLVLTVGMVSTFQLDVTEPGNVFFAIALTTALIIVVRLPNGIYVGGYTMLQIAIAFSLGYQAAMILALLAAGVAVPIRLGIGRFIGLSWQNNFKQAVEVTAHATLVPLTLVLVAQIFPNVIHGLIPVMYLAQTSLGLIIAALMVFMAVFSVFYVFWLSLSVRNVEQYIRSNWPSFVANSINFSTMGLFIAASFTEMQPSLLPTIITTAVIVIAVSFFFRQQRRQAYQQHLLDVTSSLDKNLLEATTIISAAKAAHQATDRIVAATDFQIAIYDEANETFSFPLVYRDGQALALSERPATHGFNEHVLRSKKPLILNRDAVGAARSLGFQPDRATDMGLNAWYSLLAVPLVAANKVIGVLSIRNHEPGYLYNYQHIEAIQLISRRIAQALAKTQLLEEANQRAVELKSVAEVSTLVGASLNLEQMTNSVCRIVVNLFHAQKAAVFLVDEAREVVNLAGSIGLTKRYQAKSVNIPITSARMTAITSGKPHIIEDVERSESKQIKELDQYIRAVIDVPLNLEGQVIGVLSAYYTHRYRFSDHMIQLAETMASQMAVAVKNAHLFETERQRKRQLEALYAASTRLTTSLSLRSVLDATVTSIIEALDAEVCGALLLDEDDSTLYTAIIVTDEGGITRYIDVPNTDDLLSINQMPHIAHALTVTRLTTIRATDKLSATEEQFLRDHNLQAAMLLPIVVHQFKLGVVFVGSSNLNKRYAESQLKQAQLLLNQAAVALQNARLFESIDVALTSRMNELEALGQIAQRMASQLNIDEVLQEVVVAAAEATNSDICELIMFNERNNTLQVVASLSESSTPGLNKWPAEQGLSGHALTSGHTLIVDDIRNDPRVISVRPGVMAELATPILLNNKKLGVINVESKRVGAFDQSHARFLNHLAEHAAIAIQNAHLFETVQQRANEFNALRDLGVQLLNSGNLRQTLRLIIQEARQRVNAANVYIFLKHEISGGMTTGVNLLETGEVDMQNYFPAAQALTDHFADNEQPIIASNIQDNHLFEDFTSLLEKQNVNGAVCLPLRRGEELVGIFVATFGPETTITEDAIRFLDLLAAQAAVAIGNEQLAEQTRAGRDRLQAILHSINDGIIMLDKSGRVILANSRAEYLLNVHLNNFIGETFAQIFEQMPPTQTDTGVLAINHIRDIEQTARENPNLITRRSYELHKPTFRALQEISSPVTNEDDQVLGRLFVIRDETQQVVLDQYQKEMSEMIVHDLRAPLSGVISSIYFALEEADSEARDIDTIKTALSIALSSSDSLLQLIEAILDINKLEAGEMQLDLELQDIKVVALKMLESLNSRFEQARISVVNHIPDGLPLVDIDQQTIERVFHNLVDNAIRHTPEDGTLFIRVDELDTHLRVLVEDTGRGVEKEMREKIFERFTQNERSQRFRGSKGSGLGLTFCRLAIEAHGGRIWVDEGAQGGAAFHFTLPLSPEQPAPTD